MAQTQYFCGLDLGTHTLKAGIICAKDEENLDLMGVFETRATGFKEASISDIAELSDCIQHVMQGVMQKTGIKVHAVQLGISGSFLAVRRSSAIIPLIDSGTKVVSAFDLRKVDHQAKLLGVNLDEDIIHDFPQWYRVDDVNTSANPAGLVGRKIESSLLLLTAQALRLRNLTKAVHQAGFEVNSVAFSGFAAGDVAVDKEDKTQGCALVDIGANITSVIFFKNGIVGDVQFIPWGGNYITQTIAERLSLTVDLAEEIKKTQGQASQSDPKEVSGEILVKREKGYMPIRREAVCEAVNWEIENFLTHLEAVVKGSNLYYQLNKGIVMVGGGSLLTGAIERIEERVNRPVRMGASTPGLNNAPVYAAAIGLGRMHYLKKKQESLNIKTPAAFKDKIVNSVRELCQEYF
ncbi:MAG: cell division protein FtsA [Candidatus Omnitrophica bacterium]|nr:cell division protein FtsA [Candidatus Omnitrophota bacterium]MDE2221878.1 cell division protein FtsA [Candidatus Omnitrophota bacterium]